MKLRLLTILLATVLLTGCAGDAGNDNVTNNASQESTQTDGTNSEGTDSEGTDSEGEVYVLNFEANTIEGESLTSECFADSKLTMINVWATYCNPCLSEMPDLGAIAASYDTADFRIIGIVSDVVEDADEETIGYAKELIAETEANYPHLLLNESLYVNLVGAVDSVPTTFFINQKGEMLGYVIGAQSKDVWEGIINDLLAEME